MFSTQSPLWAPHSTSYIGRKCKYFTRMRGGKVLNLKVCPTYEFPNGTLKRSCVAFDQFGGSFGIERKSIIWPILATRNDRNLAEGLHGRNVWRYCVSGTGQWS